METTTEKEKLDRKFVEIMSALRNFKELWLYNDYYDHDVLGKFKMKTINNVVIENGKGKIYFQISETRKAIDKDGVKISLVIYKDGDDIIINNGFFLGKINEIWAVKYKNKIMIEVY